MNGDTKLAVSGWSHRTVRLQQGQILFELLEPGPSKVSVVSGDLKLIDVGTVFEVARDGRDTRLLVSDGAVIADPDGARLEVHAGERLDTVDGAAGPPSSSRRRSRLWVRFSAASWPTWTSR